MYQNSKDLTKLICLYQNDINKRTNGNKISRSIEKTVKHVLTMARYAGYSQTIKDDVLQTTSFNLFNSINNFKIKPPFEVDKLIKLKPKSYFRFNNYENIEKYCGHSMIITEILNKKKKTFKALLVKVEGFGWNRTYSIIEDEEIDDIIFDHDMVAHNDSFAYITSYIINSFRQVINEKNQQYRILQIMFDDYKIERGDGVYEEIDRYHYNFTTSKNIEEIEKMKQQARDYNAGKITKTVRLKPINNNSIFGGKII